MSTMLAGIAEFRPMHFFGLGADDNPASYPYTRPIMANLKRDLIQYARFLRESGCLYLEAGPNGEMPVRPGEPGEPSPRQPSAKVAPRPARPKPPAPEQPDLTQMARASATLGGVDLPEAERRERLVRAKAIADACTKCDLCKGRTRGVYGTGSPTARIMFIGEGPGGQEDLKGEPFVGPAGQLLDKMVAAIGFRREEVYICNTVKCRPPDNRDPLPKEKAACEPYLLEQIEIVRPSIIVGLGAHACSYLTGIQASLGRMRRRWHAWRGIPTLATYHPAFLLRNPEMKRQSWEDFQMLAAKYNAMHPEDRREIWRKK